MTLKFVFFYYFSPVKANMGDVIFLGAAHMISYSQPNLNLGNY